MRFYEKFGKMIRNSNITEYIDRYLSEELTGDELRAFNAEMAINPDLEEEISIHLDIEAALKEDDIISLRENLEKIIQHDQPEKAEDYVVPEINCYSFELSDDLSSFKEFKSPVNISDILNFAQSLPKLHLAQHKVAEKENVHQYYREQLGESDSLDDELDLTPLDEALFADVQASMDEKDIADLRANLQQISKNIPAHPFHSKEIEQYLDDDLDSELQHHFEAELGVNSGLAYDIELHREIDKALGETDILDLRASLNAIQQTESSTSRKIEEIDQFLNLELSEPEMASFEAELTSNPDLVAEIELYREIDQALMETDIMTLRDRLSRVSDEIIREKRRERSLFTRIPNSRIAIGTIAASLILLISITSLLSRHKTSSEQELYSHNFHPYEATGIFRSGTSSLETKMTTALHAYNDADYEKSIEIFDEILTLDGSNPVSNFYRGMAYQQLGNYSEATESYDRVIQNKDNLFVEQAQWYRALCTLQADNRRKACKQFRHIANHKGYYSEKAAAILQELDELSD